MNYPKFLINYGLGDCFNQIFYLHQFENLDKINIIVKTKNYDFLNFMLKKFILYQRINTIEIVDFDVRYEYKAQVFNKNKILYDINKLNLFHESPAKYENLIKIDEEKANFLLSKFCFSDEITDKTVIFFPERSDNYQINNKIWEKINQKYIKLGYKTYTNLSFRNDVYRYEKTILDSKPLGLSYDQLHDFISLHNKDNIILIGQRSGIFDYLKHFGCKQKIIFPSEPSWLYPECHFNGFLNIEQFINFNEHSNLEEILERI